MIRKVLTSIVIVLLSVSAGHALPSRYDLRDYGRITSVKDQHDTGLCWAFAALGAMESNYLTQKLGKAPDLSEAHTAYYIVKDSKPERSFTPRIKKKGTFMMGNSLRPVIAFMSRLSGPAREEDMRFTSTTNLSSLEKYAAKKSPEDYARPMRLREAYPILLSEVSTDIETKKKLIMEHGALAASMYISDKKDKYKPFGKDHIYFDNSHGKDTNHVVLLAGWDDNFSRKNFSPSPSKDGAWLVKNSWGKWGKFSGYFWMPYEQILHDGTAFIVEANNPNLRHYGYDDLGLCSWLNVSWGANVFRIREDNEYLKEAAFYTLKNNVSYELYVYELGSSEPESPIDGKMAASVTGKIEFAGFHTINLPEEIRMKKGEYFSVVLKLSNNMMPEERKRNNYSENAAVNAKESYFSRDGKNWTNDMKSNACIKAFTIVKR